MSVGLVLGLGAQRKDRAFTGQDGALSFMTPGTLAFDPKNFAPPLNATNDGVYQFSSISIGKEVTVKLSSKALAGPVIWLSQGPVVIEGDIDLDGEDGGETGAMPSTAGAGGYAGGAPTKSGYGPQNFKLNEFLVPLVGGTGGAGGATCRGGAGGGALLIASESSITIRGRIHANGGKSATGCIPGGGGAIRLVAPTIDGEGSLSAKAGGPDALDGRVLFRAGSQVRP